MVLLINLVDYKPKQLKINSNRAGSVVFTKIPARQEAYPVLDITYWHCEGNKKGISTVLKPQNYEGHSESLRVKTRSIIFIRLSPVSLTADTFIYGLKTVELRRTY